LILRETSLRDSGEHPSVRLIPRVHNAGDWNKLDLSRLRRLLARWCRRAYSLSANEIPGLMDPIAGHCAQGRGDARAVSCRLMQGTVVETGIPLF
jgi:hypothetical protein